MKNLEKWAERECRLACKKENPNYDFDNESEDNFDYGCSCYKSALKAFKSLLEDGHSGYSIVVTKTILNKLIDNTPLTPITDDDFFMQKDINTYEETGEWLTKHNLKSDIQCSRMSSLFRQETLDGKVTYMDVDRTYCVNVEEPSDTFSGHTKIIDEMFPITMPYYPEKEKYKIYIQYFLTDKAHGDFDTKGILYVITPTGEKIDINRYMTEKDGEFVNITKEEYDELLKKRIDKLNEKIAHKLIWTLISNSSDMVETERREKSFSEYDENKMNEKIKELSKLCKFFCIPEHYKYNTFEVQQDLCRYNIKNYNVPELIQIAEFLKQLLEEIK